MRAFAVLGFNDKAFYKKMLAISVPIMLQQLISTAMYMVDTMMIGGWAIFSLPALARPTR